MFVDRPPNSSLRSRRSFIPGIRIGTSGKFLINEMENGSPILHFAITFGDDGLSFEHGLISGIQRAWQQKGGR